MSSTTNNTSTPSREGQFKAIAGAALTEAQMRYFLKLFREFYGSMNKACADIRDYALTTPNIDNLAVMADENPDPAELQLLNVKERVLYKHIAMREKWISCHFGYDDTTGWHGKGKTAWPSASKTDDPGQLWRQVFFSLDSNAMRVVRNSFAHGFADTAKAVELVDEVRGFEWMEEEYSEVATLLKSLMDELENGLNDPEGWNGRSQLEEDATGDQPPVTVDEPPVNKPPVNKPPVNEPPVNEPPVEADSQEMQTDHNNNGFIASISNWIIKAIFKLKFMRRIAIKAERKLWDLRGDALQDEWIETGRYRYGWVPDEAAASSEEEAAAGTHEDTTAGTHEDTTAGTHEDTTAGTNEDTTTGTNEDTTSTEEESTTST